MSTRRFAMITPNYYPRVCGVGDFSARFASELARRGHEVAIFSRGPVERHPQAPEIEARAVEGRLPVVIARNVNRTLQAYGPTDVLLQYTAQMWGTWRFGSPATVDLAIAARRAGARFTVIAHEPYVPFKRRPDLAVAAATQRLQLGALLTISDRAFVTTQTRVEMLQRTFRTVLKRSPGVVRVGANALPVPRRLAPGAPNAPRLGIFSTAAVGKRFDVVLESFELVWREFPLAELVIIGDLGPPDSPNVRSVFDGVARHPGKANIRMTGRVTLPEVAQEIADLDIYVFPMDTGANTRSSTLPTALGSGLPSITTLGIETDLALFRDGENIVFAEKLSGRAFGEAALRLLRDPESMARVGAGARRLYDEHLAWDRTVGAFLSTLAAA
jgi:glycosyltransferase involved in cell wall biosynthesis